MVECVKRNTRGADLSAHLIFEHIEEWRSQRLPGSLAALGPGKALLIQYEKDEVSDEEVGVEELEWPYADLCRTAGTGCVFKTANYGLIPSNSSVGSQGF